MNRNWTFPFSSHLFLLLIFVCFCVQNLNANNDHYHHHGHNVEKKEYCECGRFLRNKKNSLDIGGKIYDTLEPLGSGYDSKIDHAYSPSLGRCVAIKHCSEQIWLNKCSREMEVLMALNGTRNDHILHIYDHQIQGGQKCNESSIFSDYLRVVIIGSDKRRRRRKQQELDIDNKEMDNCTTVTSVIELGMETVDNWWRRMKSQKKDRREDLEMIRDQINVALEVLHGRGIAHRDVHPDNVLLFSPNHERKSGKNNVKMNKNYGNILTKLIDFGWTCCFDKAKCGLKLSQMLPSCEAAEGLTDDRFGLQDLIKELQKL